jgi:hypothetical protein
MNILSLTIKIPHSSFCDILASNLVILGPKDDVNVALLSDVLVL